ncbi:MAG: hypothetical protein R2883_00485 [Caldisericia bacterium]
MKISDSKIDGDFVGYFSGNFGKDVRFPVFADKNFLRIQSDIDPTQTKKEIEFEGKILSFSDQIFLDYFGENTKDAFCVVIEHEDGNEIIGYKLPASDSDHISDEIFGHERAEKVRELEEYNNIEISFRIKNTKIANIINIDSENREIVGSDQNGKSLITRKIDFAEIADSISFRSAIFDPLGVTKDFIIGLEEETYHIIDKTKKTIINKVSVDKSNEKNTISKFHGKIEPYFLNHKAFENVLFQIGDSMFLFLDDYGYGQSDLSKRTYKNRLNNSSQTPIISTSKGIFLTSNDFKESKKLAAGSNYNHIFSYSLFPFLETTTDVFESYDDKKDKTQILLIVNQNDFDSKKTTIGKSKLIEGKIQDTFFVSYKLYLETSEGLYYIDL